MSITTVLIANRSEIALRIQATCHAQGIKTIAVYAPEDQQASYVYQAHAAYKLSKNGFAAYLDQDEFITIAQQAGADAVHPGYGFLSENSGFAQKVIDAGLTWIGPSPESIRLMGDKSTARSIMQHAGVPVVPGVTIDGITTETKQQAKVQATSIGYPVILKDPKSGGGKAMRRIEKVEDFDHAWDMVVSEAAKLTGSTTLVLEKYVTHGRHIEVQVAGDGNNFVHFFERECSIQRRHQKIIEEAPCNFLSTSTKESLYTAALHAAQAVNYNNIGTVEFIVTPEQHCYFLEMNTRLQVEHSVTELTTGVDLVALQIEIAQSGILPLTQATITQHAHAVQCRIYAENPAQKFAPSTGTLTHFYIPQNPFCRVDHDLADGTVITPFFDPMIAKITTWGTDRNQAIHNMLTMLEQTSIHGINTNIALLKNILKSPECRAGKIHTQLLNDNDYFERVCAPELETLNNPASEVVGAIAALLFEQVKPQLSPSAQKTSAWKEQQWK